MKVDSKKLITEKEGYEAMLYMLIAYWKKTGSDDLRDILNGGGYWPKEDTLVDSAFWEYWIEAIEKVRKDGPPPLKQLR